MKVNDTKKNSKNVDNPTDITTVARGPKILQRNSKGAAQNSFSRGILVAVRPPIGQL